MPAAQVPQPATAVNNADVDFDISSQQEPTTEINDNIIDAPESENREKLVADANIALDNIASYLQDQLACGEKALAESIIRFSNKLPGVPVPALPHCFYEFGKEFDGMRRKSFKRPKIHTQPSAAQRRKASPEGTRNGSRQRQKSGRKQLPLPARKNVRLHAISHNFRNNTPVCNKARITMASRSRLNAIKIIKNKLKKEK